MPRALFANVKIIVSACLCKNWQVNILSAMNNFEPPGGSGDKKPTLLSQKLTSNSV